jgi:hypothetical protein
VEKPHLAQPSARDLFGDAVHHALRGRLCIERNRPCQAEYRISAARDYALSLACLRRGLPAYHGRGFDDLPFDLRASLNGALTTSLDRQALLRALGRTVELLLKESAEIEELPKIEWQLRDLAADSL